MKRILSMLMMLLIFFSILSCTLHAEEKESYQELFQKDQVIDILIEMDETDLQDMRNYPQNEEYHAADVTVDGITVENAGIRTKGNMTLNSVANSDSERYSYRIQFNKYVKGNKLLGLDELCLNNGYSDASYMREYLHYEILRSLGMNVPETVFCRVYLNGEYAGFYLAVEGLGSAFLKDNFGENYKDGNFYKMDEGATLEYRENGDYSYADLKSGSDENLESFAEFVKALNDVPTGEKGELENILDVDSALKYIASNTVLCNYDSYNGNRHHNYYLYENADGKFTVVPWDFNMSFGGFNGDNSDVGIDEPYISGSLETLPLMNKLLSVPEYKEKYYGYIKEIMTLLENFSDRVSELKAVLAPYVKEDTTAFYSYDEFDQATTANGKSSMIDCVTKRLENLQKQFSGEAVKTTAQQSRGDKNRPGMQDGKDRRELPQNSGNGNQPGTPPEGQNGMSQTPPQGDMMGNPPQDGEAPPERPERDMLQDGETPPEKPDGNMPQDQNGTPPKRPEGDMSQGGHPGVSNRPQNNTIRVHVNGHLIRFESDPYLKNDSTMVGFRAILEALGADVTWDDETKTVTAIKGDTTVSLTIGENTAYVNGEKIEIAASPEISGQSTMIPIRFISEQLGMKVGWESENRLVTIVEK